MQIRLMDFTGLKPQAANREFSKSLGRLYSSEEAGSMARIVLCHVMKMPFHLILVENERVISFEESNVLCAILNRLLKEEPLQYILGTTIFFDYEFRVSPAVLIPRQETEELVQWIIESVNQQDQSILDIGTGSGCIAVSLAKRLTGRVCAIDVSEEALHLAAENAKLLDAEVSFQRIDALSELHLLKDRFNIIVSNPPYVGDSERKLMQQNVLGFEPELALFVPDNDPLLFYNKITEFASTSLLAGGMLFFEINERFGQATASLVREFGFSDIELRKDINGKDRFIRALRNE